MEQFGVSEAPAGAGLQRPDAEGRPDARLPPKPGSVGVVVVNWNNWRDTVGAYRSLLGSSHPDWTLIVVDNASADDSVQALQAHIADFVLIESPANTGFAGGCNLGVEHALALGLDYVLLLNSDAMVEQETLGALLAASARLGDRAVLGSVVRYFPSGQIQFFGSRTWPAKGRPLWFREPADAGLLEQPLIETDFILGAALFCATGLFAEVGLFDERFFLNFEETDWCYRAAAAGLRCHVVTGSVVHHRGGATVGPNDGPLQVYFLNRNRLLFNDRHATTAQRLLAYAGAARSLARGVWRGLRARGLGGLTLDPRTRALALGLRDYALQRFGDCPPEVRALARLEDGRAPP